MNYAKFRSLAVNKGWTDENAIYNLWLKCTFGNEYKCNPTPFIGLDSKYHFIYISVRSDGMIYVGKHSTSNLNDGYKGSGTEIKISESIGYTFKTTPLCFYPSEDMAFAAEAVVVNEEFLIKSSEIVLNKVLGGNRYPSRITAQQVIDNRNKSKIEDNLSEKKSRGIQSFKSKGIPVGSEIKYKYKNIVVKTIDEDNGVWYKNRKYTIYELTKELFRKYGAMEPRPNGYRYFTYNGVVIDKIK